MAAKDLFLESFLSKAASFAEDIDNFKRKYREIDGEKQQFEKKIGSYSESLFSTINALQVFQKDVISKLSDYKMEIQEKEIALGKAQQQILGLMQELNLKKGDPRKVSDPAQYSKPAPTPAPDVRKQKQEEKLFNLDKDIDYTMKKNKKMLDLDDDFDLDIEPKKNKAGDEFDFGGVFKKGETKSKPKPKDKDEEIYLFDL
jgi:hypothetical protein